MTLTPAVAKIVADAKAKHEAKDGQARELLLNKIANTVERIRATPGNPSLDREQAIYLLNDIERWCVGQHDDGYLTFRDPSEEVETLEA
ncbi:hypothetical protein [Mesorhizobium koreense]|uniref:hypothetical protein n=1 Tax=Mesorhizobium koreense TaxID=3074855 RepID=UPI00287BA37D|nr:hypothetical protein [Mesorhizobium sp. WR6]